MLEQLIPWLQKAIMYGTILLFASSGEIITEKSGNMNLGVPGIMYLGGFAAFASAYLYEKSVGDAFSPFLGIFIPVVCAFIAAALGGLLFSFLTITLRANQNVTGLAINFFGKGLANFIGALLTGEGTAISANKTFTLFSARIPFLSTGLGIVSEVFFSYGFMVYMAVIIAVVVHLGIKRSRTGLNLRAVGESPATADAAGINVTSYKYIATCLGAGITGLGGAFFILDYKMGMWSASSDIEALGWLALALVIFTTWKPLNAIWGSYLFGFLYWTSPYIQGFGVKLNGSKEKLYSMTPYIVTILVLIFISMKKKKENQAPSSLGLSYFREER